jgi:hypothetical protein
MSLEGADLKGLKNQALEQESIDNSIQEETSEIEEESFNEDETTHEIDPSENEPTKIDLTDTPLQVKPEDAIGSTIAIPPDDDVVLMVDAEKGFSAVPVKKDSVYSGQGFVMDPVQKEAPGKKKSVVAQGVPDDTSDNVEKYMNELDAETEKERVKALKNGFDEQAAAEGRPQNSPDEEEENLDAEDDKDFDEKYNKAIILIDKTGMGSAINFTDEEREKLQRVKTIRLEEVEMIQIATIKTKKAKKNSSDKILQRQASVHTTPIVLSASGYTAVMKGCSTYELISLMTSAQNALIDTRTKWTMLWNKLESTSIGTMDFDTFLQSTASVDYNTFIYGVLCSTYPDDDKIPMECPKCKKPFDHSYSTRSLIRAEKMSEKMQDLVAHIVDSSHTSDGAKRAHSESTFNTVKSIRLPSSGYIVELHVQSAYDLINNSIKGLSENEDARYNQASVMSTAIKTIHIPDPEEADAYLSYEDALDITKFIYSLHDTDILVLTKHTELVLDDLTFEFGLMDVNCANPKCNNKQKSIPFDIESILFYRYQQAMNTKIE